MHECLLQVFESFSNARHRLPHHHITVSKDTHRARIDYFSFRNDVPQESSVPVKRMNFFLVMVCYDDMTITVINDGTWPKITVPPRVRISEYPKSIDSNDCIFLPVSYNDISVDIFGDVSRFFVQRLTMRVVLNFLEHGTGTGTSDNFGLIISNETDQ